ncbi:hypothetical protein N0Y54_30255 [Nostoc punctiforme UO1]|uniref:hypothetical protein n=1 Tax=Nostoc punctiforme TaxID=272131 RepID=UPI0030970880
MQVFTRISAQYPIESAGFERKEVRKSERSKQYHPSIRTLDFDSPNAPVLTSLGQIQYYTGGIYL